MKKFLILLSIVLAAATTGLLAADTVTAPTTSESAPAPDAPAKTGKHAKHRKQVRKARKKHHHKKADQTAPAPAPTPAQ